MWPSGLTLAMTLTFSFQGQIYNLLYLNQKWSDCHERKANISIELQGLKCDHQVRPWPWPWPSVFNVKYGISYISAKSGPIAAKRKANISIEPQASNVTNGFDLDLWILESNVTLTFDHTPDLDHGFSWSNFEIAVSQNGRDITKGVGVGHSWPWPWPFGAKVRCMDLPDSDRGDFIVGVPSTHLVLYVSQLVLHLSLPKSIEARC